MATTPYPSLFAPFTLAGRPLRNRIVHASMNTHMAINTRATDRLIQYSANRARGGAALIVTEPISMAPHQNVTYRARGWNDDNLDKLKRWAEAVESQDCRLLGQIQDPGRGRHNTGLNAEAIGPSALPDDLSWIVPHVLTVAELHAMIEQFAQSALRLQRCGFSGVEISAGHGHLFHQFLSPWCNQRTDEYGGDTARRTRFVVELIAALRAACGRGFIVGIRLPGNDYVPGGVGVEDAATIASLVTRSGDVDYVNFVQGTHGRELEWHLPDGNGPRMPYLGIFREIRKAIPGVPLMAIGRITEPAEAEQIIASGEAELVGLGRPILADAAWPLKASQGRAAEIRRCVWCNICWDTINTRLREIACVNNPRVAEPDDTDWRPSPAKTRRRVVVVGAGVAGMEAAWIAAARGHDVTVFGRSPEVGGKTRLHSRLPGSEPLSGIYDYQLAEARKAGVQFKLGVTASAADVIALKPDVVVLATGARMVSPSWLPPAAHDAGSVPDLRSAMSALLAHTARHQSGAAVIYDMDHTEGTYAAAELLRTRFDRVVIITPRESIAQGTSLVTRQGIQRRAYEQRIEIIRLAEPRWSDSFNAGKLEYANVYGDGTGVITDVKFFAYSTPRAPDDALAAPLRAAGIEVRQVGDCRSARGLLAATAEGHAAGNAV